MSNLINPILFDAPEKNADEKEYIILYYIDDHETGETIQDFERVCGRISAYISIFNKLNMYGNDLDLDNSLVLVETKQTQTKTGNQIYFMSHPNDSLSVGKFIEYCQAEGRLSTEVLEEYRIDLEVSEEPDLQNQQTAPSQFYKGYMSEYEFYDNQMLTTRDSEGQDV